MSSAMTAQRTGLRSAGGSLGWLLLGTVFLALLAGLALNGHTAYDPAWLFVSLNAVFLTIVPLLVAWFSVAAYRSTGVTAALAIGTGMLAVGAGGGAVPGLLRYLSDPNATVTMHNSAVLMAGAAQLLAAGLSVAAPTPRAERHRVRDIVIVYCSVVVALAVEFVLLQTGNLPAFFSVDGPTGVRQVVLGLAVEAFGVATVVWALTYVRLRLPFARTYAVALALFTMGLTGVFFQHVVGNVVCWVGRGAQYAGALYLLAAVWQLRARSGAQDRAMGMSLQEPAVRFQPMVESATDAFIVLEGERVVYLNAAASRLLGCDAAEVFGERLTDLVAAPSDVPAGESAVSGLLHPPGATGDARWEGELQTRGGVRFPAEVIVYRGRKQRVCVIRDMSERAAAQHALRSAQVELEHRAAQLEEAQRVANVGSWSWDDQLDEVTFSPQMFVIAGMHPRPGPMPFAVAAAHVHPDDLVTSRTVIQQALHDGLPFEFDQRIVLPGGELRHVLARGELMRDESGAVRGVNGTTQDVTTLRRAQDEAIAARARAAEEAERARVRSDRERYAREVNDSIVQGLVAAEIALDRQDAALARRLVGEASHRARHWIGELLAVEGPLRPGAARRSRPVDRRVGARR